MRLEIITDDNMISLGVLAKDIFVDGVLVVYDDKQFDTLQTVEKDTLEKIKALPVSGGFTQEIKNGTIKAFEKMEIGRKYLCVSAWITSYESDEAKLYWKAQELVNQNKTLQEATNEANEWLVEYRAEKAKSFFNSLDSSQLKAIDDGATALVVPSLEKNRLCGDRFKYKEDTYVVTKISKFKMGDLINELFNDIEKEEVFEHSLHDLTGDIRINSKKLFQEFYSVYGEYSVYAEVVIYNLIKIAK